MSYEAWIALAGVVVPVLCGLAAFVFARAGAQAGVKVHLHYLRRDVDDARRSARAAHWRLDEVGAPPAPTVHG